MNRTVTVKPKSSKSKNRLCNIMDGNPVCVVEQDTGEMSFTKTISAVAALATAVRIVADRLCTDVGEIECPVEVVMQIADELEELEVL
jgi:hypothetical protein